ncbi:MAG: hypothetical protein IJ725_00680, partial [Ruminococcus sp.]|nr:hypothetical protein [Ruminococcus sp.]
MIMIKKYAPKLISAALSLMIVFSVVATTAYTAGAESVTPKAASGSSAENGGELFKEESVYVIADAEGTPSK